MLAEFKNCRALTEQLSLPVSEEDAQLQSMPDASPVKWHLAHSTWFFETFVLDRVTGYKPFNSQYKYLYNSYYNAVGQQYPRHRRGLISRPSLAEISLYRQYVSREVSELLQRGNQELLPLIELGIHHEQQHQELLLTDLLHAFWHNPLHPAYKSLPKVGQKQSQPPCKWLKVPAGLYHMGCSADSFCFDNEKPQHKVWLDDFAIQSRTVTNGEYLQFITDEGYANPLLWHSDGWLWVQTHQIKMPLYWLWQNDQWWQFSLSGLQPLDLTAPVSHINWYEASAYAQFMGYRLPTEQQWEIATQKYEGRGEHFCNLDILQPTTAIDDDDYLWRGNNWEWTSSSYSAYSGFKVVDEAIGEYNGKFMANQYVLKGGSCLTSQKHYRSTYRNFFHPHQNWQFTGLRCCK